MCMLVCMLEYTNESIQASCVHPPSLVLNVVALESSDSRMGSGQTFRRRAGPAYTPRALAPAVDTLSGLLSAQHRT